MIAVIVNVKAFHIESSVDEFTVLNDITFMI